MLKKSILLFSLMAFAAIFKIPHTFAAAPGVGTVTRIQNTASVIREGQELPIQPGAMILENDEIRSSEAARVEITFIDGTRLTIGENSRIAIDEYVYNPHDNIGKAIISAIQGPFRFITGKIGKLKDKRVEVRTNLATIGIRGTDFWGGPSPDIFGVFLLKGTIIVFNSAGGRIIDTPGTGVNLTGVSEIPGEVTVWNAARAQAAINTVTFR
ncbi:MAG: FecR family protein [Sneathiella sp.]|nr:FecR family protein [Sneathiella sp.]